MFSQDITKRIYKILNPSVYNFIIIFYPKFRGNDHSCHFDFVSIVESRRSSYILVSYVKDESKDRMKERKEFCLPG